MGTARKPELKMILRHARASAHNRGRARRPRRPEARPLVDLSDFQSAQLSDFRPALTACLARGARKSFRLSCDPITRAVVAGLHSRARTEDASYGAVRRKPDTTNVPRRLLGTHSARTSRRERVPARRASLFAWHHPRKPRR